MLSGETSSGFKYEIAEDALDDWELTELLIDAQDGDVKALRLALIRLVGDEGYKALKEHVRSIHGKCTNNGIMQEAANILNGDLAKN